MAERKKIKVVRETDKEKIESTAASDKYKTTQEIALETVTDIDNTFLNRLAGGTNTRVMDVVVYDKINGGETFRFPMRILSIMEEQEVLLKALEEFSKLPEYGRMPALLAQKEAYHRVYKALCPNKDSKPSMGEMTVKNMSLNQILNLHEHYQILAEVMSPNLDEIDEVTIDALCEEVKKNSNIQMPLSHKQLKSSLVSCLQILNQLRTGNFSTGGQS